MKTKKDDKEQFSSFNKIGEALLGTFKFENLIKLIIKEIINFMDADRGTFYIVDKKNNEIWSKVALKTEQKIVQKIGSGLSGFVAKTGKTINLSDAYKDPRFDPTTDKKLHYKTRSILCIPVWSPKKGGKREVIAVIQILNKKRGVFTEIDEKMLKAISAQVAITLSNANLFEQLEQKYKEIDFLFEFEKLLSFDFDLTNVLQKILDISVQYFKFKLVALFYEFDGEIHLQIQNREGEIDYTKVNNPTVRLLDIIKNEKDIRQNEMIETLQEYSSLFNKTASSLLKIYPLKIKKHEKSPACFIIQTQKQEILSNETMDFHFLDVVSQRISRVFELHYLRKTSRQNERLSDIGKMMSAIVHDIRNPLNNIIGYSELLNKIKTSDIERKRFSDIIISSAQSIFNFTKEILDFSKGKTSILPRKCAAIDIIKKSRVYLEQIFKKTNINYEITINSEALMNADIDKFLRVIYNISKNAKEAMGKKGKFLINVYDKNNYIVFEFKDTGQGISSNIKNNIFESFTTSGKKDGTGLGLAIVKKIVDDHNGKIGITSEKDVGTTFVISIPQLKE